MASNLLVAVYFSARTKLPDIRIAAVFDDDRIVGRRFDERP